jgi:hypothetical protein
MPTAKLATCHRNSEMAGNPGAAASEKTVGTFDRVIVSEEQ